LPEALLYHPTAVQASAVVQETPERTLPVGLGADWIDQAAPFQRSTSAPPEDHPTAMQPPAAVHATCSSTVCPAPDGTGTAWIVQAEPFHRSASGV
jgi:hypothetical protein